MTIASLYDSPMAAASSLLGANEKDAAVADFLTTGGANLDPATQAWCAAFVGSSLQQAGVQGTGKMNARSYLDWGQPVDQPMPGDVAVFSRGDPNGWQGHVGFYQGMGPDGKIQVLGGNQGDSVSVAGFDPGSLLGYRRAGEAPAMGQGFNPNAAPLPGVEDLFLPKQQAAAGQRNPEADHAEVKKAKQAALFDILPGLYG
jgi:uncharacterized protein (TIGR02594 family)